MSEIIAAYNMTNLPVQPRAGALYLLYIAEEDPAVGVNLARPATRIEKLLLALLSEIWDTKVRCPTLSHTQYTNKYGRIDKYLLSKTRL